MKLLLDDRWSFHRRFLHKLGRIGHRSETRAVALAAGYDFGRLVPCVALPPRATDECCFHLQHLQGPCQCWPTEWQHGGRERADVESDYCSTSVCMLYLTVAEAELCQLSQIFKLSTGGQARGHLSVFISRRYALHSLICMEILTWHALGVRQRLNSACPNTTYSTYCTIASRGCVCAGKLPGFEGSRER